MSVEHALVKIRSDRLSVAINPMGAELFSLCRDDGDELLWSGDPAWWGFRAPLLFPIVGMLAGGRYRYAGATYGLEKHGFARRRLFTVASAEPAAATFRLETDEDVRSRYPFAFVLEVTFCVEGAALKVEARARNLGSAPMPVSFGFHPALAWPLPQGGPREEHQIVFDHAETAPIRQVDADGLLTPDTAPTPVRRGHLRLRDSLFHRDALIFDDLRSARVSYLDARGRGVRVGFEGMPLLGLWTKPGAPFLCIEPWSGVADPVGFDGDIFQKPHILRLDPGGVRSFAMTIEAL